MASSGYSGRTRFYLSAVGSQFRDCRNALASDLRTIGAEVVLQEDFRQLGWALLEKLQDHIAGCDRVIALVGDAYGAEPPQGARPAGRPRRSYTQWEYFFALGERLDGSKALPKAVYVYFADTHYLQFHPVEQEPELAALQKEFIAAIHDSGRDYQKFDSVDELTWMVLRDGFSIREQDQHALQPAASLDRHAVQGARAVPRRPSAAARQAGRPGDRHREPAGHARPRRRGQDPGRHRVRLAPRRRLHRPAVRLRPSAAELRANLANLAGVLGMTAEAGRSIEQQLAEVLRWLDAHPGWLLIIDNVNTEEAARRGRATAGRGSGRATC